jgi:hypothetical protein
MPEACQARDPFFPPPKGKKIPSGRIPSAFGKRPLQRGATIHIYTVGPFLPTVEWEEIRISARRGPLDASQGVVQDG